jgi:hypothetical protein
MVDTKVVRRAADQHFVFLSAYGFDVSEYSCAITYSSPAVTIQLAFGPPQFEVDLAFWRSSAADLRLNIGDLEIFGADPKAWVNPHLNGLEAQVAFLATAVQAFEDQLCPGDPAFYEALASARRVRVVEWHLEEKLRSLRIEAEAAWRAKDYVKVARSYEQMQPNLESLEEKRLSYATRKLAAPSEHGI